MCVTDFTIEEKLIPTESSAVLEKAAQQEKESVNIFQNRKILYIFSTSIKFDFNLQM